MLDFLVKLNQKLNIYANDKAYLYKSYGLLQLISNPIFYLLWVNSDSEGYENIFLRLGITLFSIPLVLVDHWPEKLKKFIPLYWYGYILYSVAFFFTYMLLKNGFSVAWSLNSLSGIVLAIFLLDLLSLIIILLVGVFLGFLCYFLSGGELAFPPNFASIVITYSAVLIFGGLFSSKRENIQKKRLESMKLIGASVAHELHTPLASIQLNEANLQHQVPLLINTYRLVKTADEVRFMPHELTNADLKSVEESLEAIHSELYAAKMFIRMLLAKAGCLVDEEQRIYSMAGCVTNALSRYPFKGKQQSLVHWQPEKDIDFLVQGSHELMTHVIFNLLRNALYFLAQARKGEIKIWLERNAVENRLCFKDTGMGISSKILPRIFEQFFTANSHHGSGIGLAFCKMVVEAHQGKVRCESVEGEYCLFVLSFPDDSQLQEDKKRCSGMVAEEVDKTESILKGVQN